ncbi:hypothetical protein FACS1894218_0350 [Bacilli bacterium]|nr:hypothetical protein FACS1894218_0350 [Bacilli bacterium]
MGADDGIGVAMILAIFANNALKHGPLEALLTSDEEAGLEGAMKFDVSQLKAQYLINIDGEDDKEICIGCPGSTELQSRIPYKRDSSVPKETSNLRICLNGLVGGHSGMTIAQKRINAIKEIFMLLSVINQTYDIRLVDIHKSGTGPNVIPSECIIDICVPNKDFLSIKKVIVTEGDALKVEFDLEKQLKLVCRPFKSTKTPLTKADSHKIIGCYAAFPNGVFTYN